MSIQGSAHDHVRVRVEQVVVWGVGDLVDVNVHASVVTPVVGTATAFSLSDTVSLAANLQSDDKPDTVGLRSGDDVVCIPLEFKST